MSKLVRSASLTGYAELARSVGLDPLRMLRMADLPPACLDNPDLRVPTESVSRLLETSAALSGVESFGLRLAETRRLSNLGMVGLLARDAPTLREALLLLVQYSRLHNGSLFLELEESGGIATLREELLVHGSGPMRQSTELVLGVMFRILRIFLGADWSPRRVCFVHPAPLDLTVHRRLFGHTLEFGCDFNGVVCTGRDLDTSIASSDPVMARYARQSLDAALTGEQGRMEDDVRQLILALLPSGRCTIEQVARHLGVDRRTVHRQLLRSGASFGALLQDTRAELSARYLESPNRPLSEIAALLGFSGLSAYSRWHRTRFGTSARTLRTGVP